MKSEYFVGKRGHSVLTRPGDIDRVVAMLEKDRNKLSKTNPPVTQSPMPDGRIRVMWIEPVA